MARHQHGRPAASEPAHRLFIAGELVEPQEQGDPIAVRSSADGEVLGHVARGGAPDVDAAVLAARAGWLQWSRSTPEERASVLRRLAELLSSRSDTLAETISLEVGTPIRLSRRLQVGLPVSVLERFAADVVSMDFEERIDHSRVLHEPVGVVGAITPWNYPLHQVVAKLGAAVAAGCALVVKPSDVAPLGLFELADATRAAGLPDGVFNIVTGDANAGEALVSHPGVDHVSFTGSSAVGAQVAASAARRIARCSLELGGKSASVVLPDADLGRAVRSSVGNAFLNSGQTCTAWSRLLVHHRQQAQVVDLAREATAKLPVGHPLDENTRLGPLSTPTQVDRVHRYVEIGRAEARIVHDGVVTAGLPSNGNYVAPVIFADVSPDAVIAQQEIFGPVLAILPYHDEDEALEIANGTRFGLTGAVWSGDAERARALARQLRAGQVDVNGAAFNPGAPFGGIRNSGLGREFGVHGIRQFTELRSIQEMLDE